MRITYTSVCSNCLLLNLLHCSYLFIFVNNLYIIYPICLLLPIFYSICFTKAITLCCVYSCRFLLHLFYLYDINISAMIVVFVAHAQNIHRCSSIPQTLLRYFISSHYLCSRNMSLVSLLVCFSSAFFPLIQFYYNERAHL